MAVQLIFPKHHDTVTTLEANRDHAREAYLKFGSGFMTYPIDDTTTVEKIRRAAAEHFGVALDHIALRIKREEEPFSERIVVPLEPLLTDEKNVLEELKKVVGGKISVEIKKCRNHNHCPKTIVVSLDCSLLHGSQLIYVTVMRGMTIDDLTKIIKKRTGVTPDIISIHTHQVDALPDEHMVTVETSSCALL